MAETTPKADLLRYLRSAREALLWKLEGLSEYDVRRPFTPTGTNLLGLVKHVTSVELGYLGDAFGRPFFGEDPPAWWYTQENDDPEADMWATADESREEVVALYRRAWEHSDQTVRTLPLDTLGHVPWWAEGQREATLHHVLVRVLSDTQRHAGHADVIRELIDGSAGAARDRDALGLEDAVQRERHRQRLERVAREVGGG